MSHVTLKEEQRSSMKAAFDGHDVFMWLPTGYGKSLCYQALPFMIASWGLWILERAAFKLSKVCSSFLK